MRDLRRDPDYHEGAVQIRFTPTHVLVMCPLGHLVTACARDGTWAGSSMEARIGRAQRNPESWRVECIGAMS